MLLLDTKRYMKTQRAILMLHLDAMGYGVTQPALLIRRLDSTQDGTEHRTPLAIITHLLVQTLGTALVVLSIIIPPLSDTAPK